MKLRIVILAIFIAGFGISIAAQAVAPKVFGAVLYAEGDELTVYRAKVLKSYSIVNENVVGLQLLPGDLVQTGIGTYLEIQLLPSQTVIKIAENTSFRITGLGQNSGSTIDLVYGRLRAKVDTLMGKPGFAIRGQTAVAGVRGTELGYDVIATPGIGSEPSSQIYCFSGTVKVAPLQNGDLNSQNDTSMVDNASLDKAKSFSLTQGQMLTVYDAGDDASRAKIKTEEGDDPIIPAGNRTVVLSKGIKNPIKSFWKKHDFVSKTIDTTEAEAKIANIKQDPEKVVPENPNSLADLIKPIPSFDPLTTISPRQYALQKDNDKTAGIVMISIGLAADLFGLAVYAFGTDMGFSPTDAQNIGMVSLSSGVFLNLSGIIGFISGMSR